MRRFPSGLLVSLLLVACQPSVQVYDLRCEGLVEPLGIDNTQPHFSWKIRSSGPMQQAAYELEVGSWQSGRVESSDQVMVPYGGEPLAQRQQTRWRVRIWTAEGEASAWSPWQSLGVGALNGLQGEFIGTAPGEGREVLLRKVFEVEKAGKALLYVCSLGYHEVFVNGSKVSDAVLQPAVSQLDRRAQIVTYEVSLKKGTNELLIAAGSGWYKATTFGTVYDGPLVKAQLDLDGEPALWTDASWEGAWSGRRDLGTWTPHRFGGEEIRADYEPQWSPVDVVKVDGVVESQQMCEPVRVLETLLPATVEDWGEGRYLVDYGRIVNAMMDVTLPALPAGTQVVATFSDFRHPDGHLEDATLGRDVYITSGKADRFQNQFNHHLMRYMLLEGLSEAPRAVNLKALRIGDDLPWEGSFESSDPELNAIYKLVEASMRNLTFGGYMVDCASIERLGYGGDGNASAQSLQSVAYAAPLYLNWLQAWADAQRPDGGLPHTAPNPYTAGGGPYWCSFLVQAAWRTYMNYGDLRPIQRFYPAMVHWLDYVDAYTVDGLLKAWPNEKYRGWYLGDWAAPKGVDVNDPASVDLVNNCALLQVYACLEQMAPLLGQDPAPFRARWDALARRIQEVFYHDGVYASGSQIDRVFPLLTGVAQDQDPVLSASHLATGLVGIPVITEWATQAGKVDWLYGLLKQKDYPGYLYMIENGATGVWEEWDGGRSHLHNCYNGIGSWFYQALGGIVALEPGYRRVRIAPQIPVGLDWVKVTQPTPYGPITVERRGTDVHYSVPPGVTVEE
jgi:alpha-L-rhamnosidase